MVYGLPFVLFSLPGGIPDAFCTVDIAGAVAYVSQVVGALSQGYVEAVRV